MSLAIPSTSSFSASRHLLARSVAQARTRSVSPLHQPPSQRCTTASARRAFSSEGLTAIGRERGPNTLIRGISKNDIREGRIGRETPLEPHVRTLSRRWQSSAATHPTREGEEQPSSSTSPSSSLDRLGPLSAYADLVAQGLVKRDEHQEGVIALLQDLYDRLEKWEPEELKSYSSLGSRAPGNGGSGETGWFSRIFGSSHSQESSSIPSNLPKGLYLHGDVGCGKSFLMDLFHSTLSSLQNTNTIKSQRVHFHQFMIDVHKSIHRLKSETRGEESDEKVIEKVAWEMAGRGRVVCLDEFQVTDIADAMILRRFLEALLSHGVVCIMTSNRHPTELYKNGIQRESFLPCIDLLNERMVVKCLDSGTDYRKSPRSLSRVFFHPITPSSHSEMDKLFLSSSSTAPPESSLIHDYELPIWGRVLKVPECFLPSDIDSTTNGKGGEKGAAKFNFQQLCGSPLGAADYVELTKAFGRVFVYDVPKLTVEGVAGREMARRFITFIDACYESKTKLFILSEVPITQIFSDSEQSSKTGEITAHQRSIMDDLGIPADMAGASSLFSGEEEIFAFARAVSRLTEMNTQQWAQLTTS